MNSTPYENQQEQRSGGQDYLPPQNPAPYSGSTGRRGSGHKSPALATWLSCMPGLGQVYVGYYQQGFINLAVVASVITMLSSGRFHGLEPFLGVFLAFFWLFNMIDANRRAHHYNNVKAGGGGEDVPEGFKLPGTGGSMLGGVALVVFGVLFILDLNFGISLAWLQDWWPLVLIAFGINLIYKARQKTV